MIVDLDNSFIRLRDNLTDALDLGESPQATICYNTQIRLAKGETYFQISNSPTSIIFNDEYEVHLVDVCGEVVEDITANVFLEEFFDSNGIKQIAWEYVCDSEHYFKPLIFRFTNTVNDDVWYSNLVNITEENKSLTTRFDFKHYENHYGTQYERANYYQSIRLATYYRNPINEDTREEYHEITTDNTAAQRNIKKRKRRFLLDTIDNFTAQRIDNMITCSSLYVDNVKHISTTPIEFNEPEMDSNIYEGELILNPVWTDTFTFSYQIFEGLYATQYLPFGTYTSATIEAEGKARFNIVPTLNTGTLTLYDASDDSVVNTFTELDMSIQDNDLYIPTLNADALANGTYYIQFPAGLVSALGIDFEGVSDTTTWRFEIIEGQYSSEQYSSTQYLVSAPNPFEDNLSLFYKFNETSGTTATDSSTNTNNGTITNATINEAGLVDRCYYFNSGGVTDEYVTIPDDDSLSFGSDAFSIEVWVNPDNNFGYILNKYNATSGDLEYRMYVQSGTLQFYIYTDASNHIGVADNVTYTSGGGWQQIVVTYDGSGNASGLKMFVNNTASSFSGVETGTFTGMSNTSQQVVLGQQSDALTGTNRYQGKMDILRIWKGHELSASEITSLYNSGNGTESI